MESAINWIEELQPLIVKYGMRLVIAIVILWIGLKVVKFLTKKFRANLEKREVSASLIPFLTSLFNTILRLLVIISVLGTLGVEMTSFAAVIASAGLAIGLALSGTLQNFAGGVIILLLKPFKVGDVIEAQGFMGSVYEIQIFYTIMKTFDNQHIILPNGKLSNESIKNYSSEETRRMVITAGIGYNDDIDKAKKICMDILTSDERVLKDPAPMVFVSELADSSVNLSVRGWARNEDFWAVYFEIFEKIKKEFDANNVSIPFPQRDVHMFKEN
ncbi:MAG: mechanosensitive ion channel family protein [Luteibaculum sp.]